MRRFAVNPRTASLAVTTSGRPFRTTPHSRRRAGVDLALPTASSTTSSFYLSSSRLDPSTPSPSPVRLVDPTPRPRLRSYHAMITSTAGGMLVGARIAGDGGVAGTDWGGTTTFRRRYRSGEGSNGGARPWRRLYEQEPSTTPTPTHATVAAVAPCRLSPDEPVLGLRHPHQRQHQHNHHLHLHLQQLHQKPLGEIARGRGDDEALAAAAQSPMLDLSSSSVYPRFSLARGHDSERGRSTTMQTCSSCRRFFGSTSTSEPLSPESSAATAVGKSPQSAKGGSDGGVDDDGEVDGDNNPNNSTEPCPPTYNGIALAREEFSHPYFYNDNGGVAEYCRGLREAAFEPTLTVDDVHRQYYAAEGGGGSTRLMQLTSGTKARFDAYFAGAKSAEEMLDSRTVAIGKVQEYASFKKAGAVNLPALDKLFQGFPLPLGRSATEGTATTLTLPRSNQICVVTGSSGSGKTFFCLHYLTDFLRESEERTVTVYLAPPARLVKDTATDTGKVVGERAVQEIREVLGTAIGRKVQDQLKMRACVIFDEAGDVDLKGMFDRKAFLDDLYAHLQGHLAENVVMVVAGTGITGGELNSSTDAYFFRLRPWSPDDLETLLAARKLALELKGGDSVKTVVDAIVANPKLNALTTNARSASFLVESIAGMGSKTSQVRDGWGVMLDAWTPALVSEVVNKYMANNGIRDLSDKTRRLVAACVFRALKKSSFMKTDLPQFPLLAGKPKAVAMALLTYNVELRGVANDRQLMLLEDECYAVSVTPAIAIVLFYMAGLQVSLVPGWRAEEEVAGLHAARRLILDCFERHMEAGDESDVTKLQNKLAEVRLVALRRQVQVPRRKANGKEREPNEGLIRVPLVPSTTVLLNGERSSFADVIAPYMLLQAKHTSDGVLRVDIEHELRKCCLLRNPKDDRVLRGLLAVWREGFRVKAVKAPDDMVAIGCYQKSPAYPENLVKYGRHADQVAYGTIDSFATRILLDGDKPVDLPRFRKNERVTFVLVTNANEIHLGGNGVKITEEMLHEDMRLDTSLLDPNQKDLWEALLRKVRPGVVIEFLFTKSSA